MRYYTLHTGTCPLLELPAHEVGHGGRPRTAVAYDIEGPKRKKREKKYRKSKEENEQSKLKKKQITNSSNTRHRVGTMRVTIARKSQKGLRPFGRMEVHGEWKMENATFEGNSEGFGGRPELELYHAHVKMLRMKGWAWSIDNRVSRLMIVDLE